MSSRRESRAKPEGLSQLNLNAAGIDVGATSHYVAVPADRAEQPVREYEAFTADLYRLADWLAECGVETVVMESTGVYWIPLFGVLEERDFQVMLVDPRRIKNVPGRKTDVRDCQWLQQLHTYGLLSGAFRPDGDIRRLRSYLRQRAMLVEYASQHIQHMQKALTRMNVKLQHVIRDITGKTGMDIMEAIAGGERNPRKLARLRDPRIKADEATIARSLQGHWREEHIFELTQALELYRFYQDKIAECDREIEAQLERFEDSSDGEPPAPNGKKRNQKNAPRFDVQGQLYRMTVEGQRKCPPKCSAKMSLGYAAMVSDDGVVDAMRTCRVGGLSASRYLLTVARWIPNSRAIPRMDIPLRFAFCIACQRAFWRKVGFRGGMAALPALLPRLATGS